MILPNKLACKKVKCHKCENIINIPEIEEIIDISYIFSKKQLEKISYKFYDNKIE